MNSKRAVWASAISLAYGLGACGDGGAKSHRLPWSEERPDVITVGDSDSESSRYNENGCLLNEQDICVADIDVCANGEAGDVIVSNDGEYLDSICYPSDAIITVEEVTSAGGEIAQNQNGVVLVLDDVDDGADLTGDIHLDGNNVVIYGENPSVSVIDGDINVDGNNIVVRGVRITGDVTIEKNNPVFAFCVIEGNLTISSNNAQLIACDVWGTTTITGNNTELHGSRFASQPEISGKNTSCNDTVLFDDANDDQVITDDEVGTSILCR